MKNLAQGIILTIISVMFIFLSTTISVRNIRAVRIREQLTTAVDNAVEDTIGAREYTIDNREEFVAALLEEVVDTYYTEEKEVNDDGSTGEGKVDTSDKITIAINKADNEKGLLSVTAQVEYKKPNGSTGIVEYSRTCVLEDNKTEGFSNVVFKYDKNRVYRAYTLENGREHPNPEDPVSEEEGKVFVGWVEGEDTTLAPTTTLPEEVSKNVTYTAVFMNLSELIHVTSIGLDETLDIEVGDTYTLTPTYNPSTATIKRCTWTSDNESVVTVNSNGRLKALSVGEANIIAKSVDGGFEAMCHVSVKEITKIFAVPSYIATTNKNFKQNFNFQTSKGSYIDSDKITITANNSQLDGRVANTKGHTGLEGNGKLGYASFTARYNNSENVKRTIPVFVYSVKGFNGDYDGQEHSIEVKCDETRTRITYSYGQYDEVETCPTFEEPGEYVVNYTISSREDFTEEGVPYSFTGSEKVIINGIEGGLSFAKDNVEVTYPETCSIKVAANGNYKSNIPNCKITAYKSKSYAEAEDKTGSSNDTETEEDTGEVDLSEYGSAYFEKNDKGVYYLKITPNGKNEGDVTLKCTFPAYEGYEEKVLLVQVKFKFGTLVEGTDFKLNLGDDYTLTKDANENTFKTSFDFNTASHELTITELLQQKLVEDYNENIENDTDSSTTEVANSGTEESASATEENEPVYEYIGKDGFDFAISDENVLDENGDLVNKYPKYVNPDAGVSDETEDEEATSEDTESQSSEEGEVYNEVVNPLKFRNAGSYTFYFEVKATGYYKYFGKVVVDVNKVDAKISVSNIKDSYHVYDEDGNETNESYGTDSTEHDVEVCLDVNVDTTEDTLDYEKFVSVNTEKNKDNEYLNIVPCERNGYLYFKVRPKNANICASTSITFIRPESTNYKEAVITVPYSIGECDGMFDDDGNMLISYAALCNQYGFDVTESYTQDNYGESNNSLYNILKNRTLIYDIDSDRFTGHLYENATKFVIPLNIKNIGSYTFYGCEQFKNISVPDGAVIGENAFDNHTTICYNGEQESDNNWNAKEIHSYGDDNKCKFCGKEKPQTEEVNSTNEESSDNVNPLINNNNEENEEENTENTESTENSQNTENSESAPQNNSAAPVTDFMGIFEKLGEVAKQKV